MDNPGKEQLAFLDRIWGESTGNIEFQQRAIDDEGNRTGNPTDTKWFTWPGERERVGRWTSRRLDDTLYFAVPQYRAQHRRSTELKTITAVYVDDDGVTGEYRVHPSVTVTSSPGHAHRYWVLSEPVDPQRALRVGFNISAAHRHDNENHDSIPPEPDGKPHKFCGTDPGGWDATQILRLPGSLNTKPEHGRDGFRVTWEDHGTVVSIEELEEAYPNDPNAQFIGAITIDEIPAELPDFEPLIARLADRPDLIRLYSDTPPEHAWSERLHALANETFRMGWTIPEVYRICLNAACNKFARGARNEHGGYTPYPDPAGSLWRDVYKAHETHVHRESNWMGVGYDPSNSEWKVDANGGLDPAVLRQEAPELEIDLLTETERERAVEVNTFIDQYVEWAESKTDAASVYHVASAFTILSLVFGEFGHIAARFGAVRLNLWFLVMGKTTRARKSTSRSLMLKVLEALESHGDPGYHYDEGSNFTAEGLENALLEKPDRSSLIHRDEVQGLFKEINGKNYMSGLNDMLTALYDGSVSGKKRATGDAKNVGSVKTNFVLFLMGIVSKITDILTLEDFQSGFLARFIHVIGEAPERTRETEWLAQAPINEIAMGDDGFKPMVRALLQTRTKWYGRLKGFTTVGIRFHDDAWKRWNDAKWEMQQAILQHDRAEVLEAGTDRLALSIAKAAALIAMADGRDTVSMDHLLVALRYGEGWVRDMVKSSEMVSESYWQKDMQEVAEMVIAKGGEARWEEVYARSGKRPSEFMQIVEGLTQSGRAMVSINENTKVRFIKVVS